MIDHFTTVPYLHEGNVDLIRNETGVQILWTRLSGEISMELVRSISGIGRVKLANQLDIQEWCGLNRDERSRPADLDVGDPRLIVWQLELHRPKLHSSLTNIKPEFFMDEMERVGVQRLPIAH